MKELQQKVMDAIAKAVPLDPATITPGATFEELGIDSLDVVNIVFELENVLNIRIPEDFALSEVGDVKQLVAAMRTLAGDADACLA